MLIQANDFFRHHYLLEERRRVLYTVSIVVHIAVIGVYMVLFDSVATSIYFVFPIVEIFLFSRSILTGIVAVKESYTKFTCVNYPALSQEQERYGEPYFVEHT